MLRRGGFAARVPGLASGLALAVRPAGLALGLWRQRHTRTISLGTGLSCLADRPVAGQPPSLVVRELPLSTGSDSPIGHVTGTILGPHVTPRGNSSAVATASAASRVTLRSARQLAPVMSSHGHVSARASRRRNPSTAFANLDLVLPAAFGLQHSISLL